MTSVDDPSTDRMPGDPPHRAAGSDGTAGHRRPRRRRGVVRGALHLLGELSITLGVVLLLFCGYQLWWTNVESAKETAKVTERLEEGWERGVGLDFADPQVAADLARDDAAAALDSGDALGFVRIPRLGEDYRKPIVEDTGPVELARGVGHYVRSALPGQVGNFAIAGHRTTHGEPFRKLDKLEPGDAVVIETRNTWLTYTIDGTTTVRPDQGEVVAPVPEKPGERPTEARLTMTTCTPVHTSKFRLVYFATLTASQPKSQGIPAALAG